jgi:hypothetical protein
MIGIGSAGYTSSLDLVTLKLHSTVAGIGSLVYMSSLSLSSTVRGLGSLLYISSSRTYASTVD